MFLRLKSGFLVPDQRGEEYIIRYPRTKNGVNYLYEPNGPEIINDEAFVYFEDHYNFVVKAEHIKILAPITAAVFLAVSAMSIPEWSIVLTCCSISTIAPSC